MTREDLKVMQGWPLERKINVTLTRIMEWYQKNDGKVYVSFSGGKDSTVLLDLARRAFPDIKAVYIHTGLDYPEVLEFIKNTENVEWIKPVRYDKHGKEYQKISFPEVINEYGWCFPYKDVAYAVYYAKRGSQWAINKFMGLDKNGNYSKYNQRYKKYAYLLSVPFPISHKCCEIMKENPIKMFERQSGLQPIVATMAEESNRRLRGWLRTGCNAFDAQRPISKPVSFWTEQDILQYLKITGLKYANVYGEIAEHDNKLYTTGLKRTGCIFCTIGCRENPNFQRLKETHPELYDYCMRDQSNNGLGLGKVLDYLNIQH